MAKTELVEKYQELVDKYDLVRQRIQKANEQKGRFKSEVVERVLRDYEQQLNELEGELAPCEAEVYQLVASLEADHSRVEGEKSRLEERRDEVELRNLLGEFSSDDYDSVSAEIQAGLGDTAERMSALQAEIGTYREMLERAGAAERHARSSAPVSAPVVAPVAPPPVASVPTAAARPAAAAPAPAAQESNLRIDVMPETVVPATPVSPAYAAPQPIPAASAPDSVFADSQAARPPEPALANGGGLWGEPSTSHVPDASVPDLGGRDVFDEPFGGGPGGDLGGANAFDMILDDFPMTVDGGGPRPSSDLGGGSALGGLTELDNQWQKELSDGFPPASGFHDVLEPGSGALNDQDFPNLGFNDRVDDLPPLGIGAATSPRAAFLIRRENMPDEDRYEIRDDVTSIGRGRDNQIQIKDDTKVSRYHCRILREPTGYYVEDNNSSNGTMVNGELITRRKIEGGEALTIGETLFRFLQR